MEGRGRSDVGQGDDGATWVAAQAVNSLGYETDRAPAFRPWTCELADLLSDAHRPEQLECRNVHQRISAGVP
eukprot:6178325-Pleurochrysis_carterae.AAC.2